MNLRDNTNKTTMKYYSNTSQFILLYFKSILLTIVTFGLYYPWAKVALLKFHCRSTILQENSFNFVGTAKDVFKSYLILLVIIAITFLFLFTSFIAPNNKIYPFLFAISYFIFISIIPVVIHGTLKYRSKNTLWKGIQFHYLGSKSELYWKFLSGLLTTFLTLGIYTPWFFTELRKYIISHLRFGNLSFEFKGEGAQLFWIQIKFIFLFPSTFGIYSFWFIKELLQFYINNIEVNQNEIKTRLQLDVRTGDIFRLTIINFALIIFSFGLAMPFVILRTYKALASFIQIEDSIQINKIQQANYKTTFKDDFLDLKLV